MIYRQNWVGRRCSEKDTFPARVPGNIQYDYAVSHGFKDVMRADNYKEYLQLEDDEWEYSAKLDYVRRDKERVYFVSLGIDYSYDVLLNGGIIYSYEGMFRPFELDLTDRLIGDDVLTVRVHKHPKAPGAKSGTRDEARESCKPPFCYGWDWNPRLLVSGMWGDAYIETRSEYYIADCEVKTTLSDDLSTGRVTFSYSCDHKCSVSLFDPDGNEVCRTDENEIAVLHPELWWCTGYGKPALYRWVIRNEREERSGFVGFRSLKLVKNEGTFESVGFPKTRREVPMTIELNGRRIFAKGTNFVNPELFPGMVTAERYEELLALMRDANMNIVRVWGGSGICKREFYDLCDRYGILVWQEFMLSCNDYKGTPHYMAVLDSEARAVIKSLRHHPSLAIWCGGNELYNSWSGMDDQSLPLRLLNALCLELDPDRPFLSTSPLYGVGHGGYEFYDASCGVEVFEEFQKSDMIAYCEFGVPSVTSADQLRKVIPEEELFPIEPTDAWCAHHGFGAWKPDSWLCLNAVKRYFPETHDVDELAERSAWMQTEGYRAAFEEMRRQWPHCSMALNWCFNEPWITAANNSLIEYPARPKRAYYAVRSALRPVCFSAKISKFSWKSGETFSAEIWLLNDSTEEVKTSVRAVVSIDGNETELGSWSAATAAQTHKKGPTVSFVIPETSSDRLVLRLDGGDYSNNYELLVE
ncbi:MAG: hypothetical protein IJS45_04510 [Clostridia bacterium]|nr:hypothetical protein [Clostridia bacterium]